ncbi:hypothetical protein X927_03645 [Petrotoga mexicana DSM 14811]|jgi:preprotein translocase subunit SecB|uniref:Preprotein translocase subunit SecB n=1 Tax=Petrotoga mexicana DSM 14811 TaxID=1122954 RepID=A0A2K1PC21_9BACT|nr:hypothetical protein [Petrotoga mexicana]PNS00237.1 hypothetical protein X927_03645 [Petrotoga mexicana DSM 14811]
MKMSNIQMRYDIIKKLNYELKDENLNNKKLTPKVDISVTQNFQPKEKEYFGTIGLNIKFHLKESKKIVLKLELETEAGFYGNPKIKENEFKELVIKSGIMSLLQISRAKIISISANFGFVPPIYLPMLNINELVEKELEKAKISAK